MRVLALAFALLGTTGALTVAELATSSCPTVASSTISRLSLAENVSPLSRAVTAPLVVLIVHIGRLRLGGQPTRQIQALQRLLHHTDVLMFHAVSNGHYKRHGLSPQQVRRDVLLVFIQLGCGADVPTLVYDGAGEGRLGASWFVALGLVACAEGFPYDSF